MSTNYKEFRKSLIESAEKSLEYDADNRGQDFKEGRRLKLREFDANRDEDKKNLLDCNIIGITEVQHYITSVDTWCSSCKEEHQHTAIGISGDADFRKFKYTKKCEECGKDLGVTLHHDQLRKILLQEPIDQAIDNNPLTVEGYVFGDNVYKAYPGQDIRTEVILRSVEKRDSPIQKRVFDITKISRLDSKLLLPTQQEIQKYKGHTMQDLIDSFAPHLKNLDGVKEGLIISLIGSYEVDGIRGDINTLLVGDPSTGKTDLLKFVNQVMQKSDYTSGRSSSTAGLLAGLDNLSDGTRIVRYGPVVLCSGGVVCIDEMDKLRKDDIASLHESMEKQTFSLRKVGVNQTLPTKTIIIGAANPVGSSKWDAKKGIRENIRLTDSLLARFGLIYRLLDFPDRDMDLDIVRHMRSARMAKTDTPLTVEDLTKFINYIKTLKPTMTDEAGEMLEKWYSALRAEDQDSNAVAIDPRVFGDLMRMATAYARIRQSLMVNEVDAEHAITLYKYSLKSLGMATPGERNDSVHMDRFSNKNDYTAYCFEEPISKEEVIEKLSKRSFYTKESALNILETLYKIGKITETIDGKWVWVN